MERKYTLANVNILFKTTFGFVDRERFDAFRSDFSNPDLTYEFSVVDELPQIDAKPVYYDSFTSIIIKDGVTYRYLSREGNEYRALISDERILSNIITVRFLKKWFPVVVTEMRLFDNMTVTHAMSLFGGSLLHSSYIMHDGKAILFTAPSQTGKSTQAELWRQHMGAEIINGDRSLIKRCDGKLFAYSLPFCGTSGICLNKCAPLEAVVVLKQAPYNRITPMRPAAAYRDIFEGFTPDIWYKDDVMLAYDLTESIIKEVPVYLLECMPDYGAVELLAKTLGRNI